MFKINLKYIIIGIIIAIVNLTIIITIIGFKIPANNDNNIKSDVVSALNSLVNVNPQIASKGHDWPTQNIPSNTENLSKVGIFKGTELYKKLNINIEEDYVLYFTSDKIKNDFINVVNNTDNIKNENFGQIEYYYALIADNAYDIFIPDNYIKSNDISLKPSGLNYKIATTIAPFN